ncbi:hypothetical protein FACS1894166_12350 [Bacilli bacterium]|nr:hypothetical protein FACS1894166_12350 [Bacilli bacterium]
MKIDLSFNNLRIAILGDTGKLTYNSVTPKTRNIYAGIVEKTLPLGADEDLFEKMCQPTAAELNLAG